MTAQYQPHPAAELFPMMPQDQYETFREDIRKNGFQQDIVLYKGQILDGRNRYKAAIELNMLDELPIAEMDDDTEIDPYQWVISRNLHRRHLNESQRGMIAAKLAKLRVGDNQHSSEGGSIDPSIQDAAKQLGVGRATVVRARAVLANGSPELIQAVEQGEVTVSKAAKVAKEVPMKSQLAVARPTTRGQIRNAQRERNKKHEEEYERRKQRIKSGFLSLETQDQVSLMREFLQGYLGNYFTESRDSA